MKETFLKIRISTSEKSRLKQFADKSGKPASEVVRCALNETMRGDIAGSDHRRAIARLRRSTNLMLEAFTGKPIDVPKLKEIAQKVREDASRVLA